MKTTFKLMDFCQNLLYTAGLFVCNEFATA